MRAGSPQSGIGVSSLELTHIKLGFPARGKKNRRERRYRHPGAYRRDANRTDRLRGAGAHHGQRPARLGAVAVLLRPPCVRRRTASGARCPPADLPPAKARSQWAHSAHPLSPGACLERIAALVPPPRQRRHRYYGVLAPNAPLRAAVTALAPEAIAAQPSPPMASSGEEPTETPHRSTARCPSGRC